MGIEKYINAKKINTKAKNLLTIALLTGTILTGTGLTACENPRDVEVEPGYEQPGEHEHVHGESGYFREYWNDDSENHIVVEKCSCGEIVKEYFESHNLGSDDKCDDCSYTTTEEKHEWNITKQATCTEEGEKECSICNEKRATPKTTQTWSEWSDVYTEDEWCGGECTYESRDCTTCHKEEYQGQDNSHPGVKQRYTGWVNYADEDGTECPSNRYPVYYGKCKRCGEIIYDLPPWTTKEPEGFYEAGRF